MDINSDKNRNSLLKGYKMLLYFTGSMIMYEPSEECVIDFWSNGILKALPVKSSNPRFIEAASQLRNSCQDGILCRKMLRDDFNRLFAGSGLPMAPPLRSNYIEIPSLSGSMTEKVSDFYNSYGWVKRSDYKVPDDNLGLELLFLTLLIDKYLSFDDEACRGEMKNEIRRFIELHILSWLPDWNSRMQEFARTLCYKGIATLIYASCEDIYDLLDSPKSEINFPIDFRN